MKKNLVYILDTLIVLLCCLIIYLWYVTDSAVKRAEQLEAQIRSIAPKDDELIKLRQDVQALKEAQDQFVQWYINVNEEMKQIKGDIGAAKGAGDIVSDLKKAQVKMEEELLLWKLDRTEWVTVFDGKSLDGWESSGTWNVAEGDIVGGDPDGSDGHTILRKDSTGKNAAITALFKRVAGSESIGLTARRSEAGGYIFGISGDSAYVGRLSNHFELIGGSKRKLSKDEWHKLTLETVGSRILCYVNDELVLDVRDKVLKEGRFGLNLYKSSARYKDVKIKVLKEIPKGANGG